MNPKRGNQRRRALAQKGVKTKCPRSCRCVCHEAKPRNPHPGRPCPSKFPVAKAEDFK